MTPALVKRLKDNGQDFEFYPTTPEMILSIKRDMQQYFNRYEYNHATKRPDEFLACVDVLDCGAGDGRVVSDLANGGKKYAIEKSRVLIDSMPEDVFIVGTEFFQSTLIDKKVDVVFCNPPYKEYAQWAEKVILEANAKLAYLILPSRWKESQKIQDALTSREAKHSVIYTGDFLDAERSARAKIDIIAVKLAGYRLERQCVDPFSVWFDSTFVLEAHQKKDDESGPKSETLKDKIEKQIVAGHNVVSAMVACYNHEMEHLQSNFMSICKLDGGILFELGVSHDGLKESLKQRIAGLKNKYWHELFNNYEKITSRLTHASRKEMLEKLTSQTSIDFTESNIYAVTVWVIKNANKYFDQQLIGLVERMIDKANVTLYKSNKRVFTDQDWRYCRKPGELTHFGLELRIILHRMGGVEHVDNIYSSYRYEKNLSSTAHEFLDDIMTVASNLMFSIPASENPRQKVDVWESGKVVKFFDAKGKQLMQAKAFLNGNLHIKFSQDFIRKLNVEFGRLKGWLTNHVQASEELNIPVEQTERLFKSNLRLSGKDHGFLLEWRAP